MIWVFGCSQPCSSALPIQEMGHAERLAERILLLKGDVEMVPAGPVDKILEPEAMLAKGMAMEEESAEFYNKAALTCSAGADSASKQVFEELVQDEEATSISSRSSATTSSASGRAIWLCNRSAARWQTSLCNPSSSRPPPARVRTHCLRISIARC